MLILAGTMRLPAGTIDRARPVMAMMIQASRVEDGCMDYAYAEDVLQPGLIRIFECWRDRAALDHHFESAHIQAWRAAWPDLGLHARELLVYEASEPRPT